uniref:VP2 n=1 Tax=Dongbei arctic lamprey calicivirus 2 TaxID=2116167 RepID=A0A2P1GMJ3_9CALI|nr:VP2 [Dongbei arctic lamprey calicivirus 2]
MAAIAAGIGTALLGAGSAVGGAIGAAHIASSTARDLQGKQLGFQQSVIDQRVAAVRSAGLPEYWAYDVGGGSPGGSRYAPPNTMIHLGNGPNVYSPIPNMTFQQLDQSGRPNRGTGRENRGTSGFSNPNDQRFAGTTVSLGKRPGSSFV